MLLHGPRGSAGRTCGCAIIINTETRTLNYRGRYTSTYSRIDMTVSIIDNRYRTSYSVSAISRRYTLYLNRISHLRKSPPPRSAPLRRFGSGSRLPRSLSISSLQRRVLLLKIEYENVGGRRFKGCRFVASRNLEPCCLFLRSANSNLFI